MPNSMSGGRALMKIYQALTDARIAQKLLEFNNACTNSDSFDINEYCSNFENITYPWQINLYHMTSRLGVK